MEAVADPAPDPAAATRPDPRAPAPAGGSRWVPPVLASSRGARFGLGGGALAVAVALVLLLANPFGGGGLPAGWQVRPENEVLHADLTVPDEYARTQSSAGDSVTYDDPSAVFQIYADRPDPATDTTHQTLPADPAAWKAYYEKGGRNGIEFTRAEVTTTDTRHQGTKAYDIVTEYTPNAEVSKPHPTRYRYHELLVPGKGSGYWRLRVSMPAAGRAAVDGEALFDRVADGFEIHDL